LEGDRWGYLARYAASRGLLNFESYNPSRRRTWLLKELVILDGVEDAIKAKLFEARLFHQAAISGADMSTEYGVTQFNRAVREFVKLGRTLLPYMSWPELPDDKISEGDVHDLRTEWEKTFGSLKDPTVQVELEHFRRLAGQLTVARSDNPRDPTGGQWA